jgi:hypothetical protein
MKTINETRSEVMKSAWVIYRNGGLTWSEALKQAWLANTIQNLDFGYSLMRSSWRNRRLSA